MALIVTSATTNTDSVPGKLRAHLAAHGFKFEKLETSPNYRYELWVSIPVAMANDIDVFAARTLEAFGAALTDFTLCDFRLVDAANVNGKFSIRIAALGLGKKPVKKAGGAGKAMATPATVVEMPLLPPPFEEVVASDEVALEIEAEEAADGAIAQALVAAVAAAPKSKKGAR